VKTGMHESQAAKTAHPARPLHVNQGVPDPKAFFAFAFLHWHFFILFISICFALRFCACIFCAFLISIFWPGLSAFAFFFAFSNSGKS
jgi:cellulose synthase/poly-beta-1,6-N-acetylglucosamine synthase-like glycosyltransferase